MTTTKSSPAKHTLSSALNINIPSGTEIYDRIMKQIEPELMTANLKKLDALYRKETKKEHAVRYQRYSKAFALYRKRYKAWGAALKKAVSAYKRAVTKAVERLTKGREDEVLRNLEEQMRTA